MRLPVAKLVTSSAMNAAGRLALDIQGLAGALAGADAIEDGTWQLAFLGMPLDPRIDEGKPFAAPKQ